MCSIPLAIDASRAGCCCPTVALTLRTAQGGETDLAAWAAILPSHAELQRSLAPHADELVALGVPDLRPERLPEIRADLLDDASALRIGRPGGLTPEQHRDLLAGRRRRYARTVRRARGASGSRRSLNHDDLHDNNVFVPRPSRVVHYRVFDWGDSSVAHPFGVLLVALRVVVHAARPDRRATPALLRLRDAYLEPWTGEFDRPTCVEAVRLALRVGGVAAR